MKIAIYGGSFNPIHYGHIGLAEWVINHTDVDEVWMMVTPNNPLKPKSMLTDENERYENAKKAVEGIPGIKVSNFEFSLPIPSYTIDTLKALKETYPSYEFVLLIGQDNWEMREKWKDWNYIVTNFQIYVYPRGMQDNSVSNSINEYANVHFLSNAPLFNISSTELRNKVKS